MRSGNKLNTIYIHKEYASNSFIRLIYTLLFLIHSIVQLTAQDEQLNNKRTILFHCGHDSISYAPETIIPGTIKFFIHESQVDIKYVLSENKIILDCEGSYLTSDTVTIHFDVLPLPFHHAITLWDSTQIKITEGDVYYHPIQNKAADPLIESSGLVYDGALTRGFSLGNNQSLVFDSELNLQLAGNIGDGYEIKAAITDNNLPIQPDGTTRQIQEFDKVYIEIKKAQHSILAGDFDAVNSPGYFMRYNRKLKGAQYSFSGNNFNQPWNIKGSAAVSRGKFSRQNIIPSEGNQGPYPLRGENGELFIVVLAGSEKVYIDGRLLVRGEDADYVMDYNQSEITFTRNILINIRHRITIEFEYAQFNFQKSHSTFEARYHQNNLVSYIHFFQENDSKSVTGDLELTSEDLSILQMAGDAGDQFYKSGIRKTTEGFNTNAILYTRKDTMVEGIPYLDILEWSTDPEKAILTVHFSEVAPGAGDYVISPNPSPNGRIYQWVAPDNTGRPTGNYAPITPLQAPQQKQMLTAGGELKIRQSGKISFEAAYSRHDLNRYSSIDDQDNGGVAFKLNATEVYRVLGNWLLSPRIGYEGSGAEFNALDPYRNPEFARDWNLPVSISKQREHLPSIGIKLGKSDKFYTLYQFDGFFRGDLYNGIKHTGQMVIDSGGWKIEARTALLESRDNLNAGKFFRPAINLERVVIKKGDWRIGTGFFEDKNEVRDRQNDTLKSNSFIQNKLTAYVKNDIASNTHLYISYNEERPKLAVQNQFRLTEKVSEWNAGGHFHQWKNIKLEYMLKHRDVNPVLTQTENRSKNLLGRFDIKTDLLKKSLKWSVGYEIGNGQEPKVEYKYVKVQKGEGFYIWIDDGNGIEEIDEFEQAPFADQGEYIKISVFNNDFIRTRALGLQQTIFFDLKNLIQKGLLTKVAGLSTYQLSRKIRENNNSPYWNPFYQQYPDTAILGYSSTLRNILYWNRSSPLFDIQIGNVTQKNQVLQTSGYDIREADDFTLRCRISLRKKMDIVLNARKGDRINRSQFFENRNFKIAHVEAGPELNVILKDKFRFTGSYQLLSQENTGGDEELCSNKFSFETVWRKSSSTDFRVQASLVNINYTSSGNPSIDFTMLQGLQDGSNFLWTAQFNTRITKTLILTLQYNGRKTGEVKPIHTGTAQVRATF